MRILTVVVLVAGLVMAGCLDIDFEGEDTCSLPPLAPLTYRIPDIGTLGLVLDPARPWEGLAVGYGPTGNISLWRAPEGWSAAAERISSTPGNVSLVRARLTPSPEAASEGHLWFSDERFRSGGSCTMSEGDDFQWKLSAGTGAPEQTSPGKGAHVFTAGFWLNGTLFYTNVARLDASDWPRAGWYAWEGEDALPVYIYDSSREEQPAYWKPQANPVTGEAIVDGYFTTIQGFNEVLKDTSSGTSRVVVIPPEKAYTAPGREGHPLYGDTLVFWIRVVDVVDVPCQEAQPPTCDLPES